jgi:hypothetical protein
MAELSAYLAEAYDSSRYGGVGPVAACAANVPRETVGAKLKELRPVLVRCHVSRVYAAFLERVLAVRE